MKANKTAIALSLLGAAALLVACERKTVTETPAGTTTTTTTVAPSTATSNAMGAAVSAMEKAGDATGDALITGMVKTKLLVDPDVKGLMIDVDTKNGVVTLNGSADTSVNANKAVLIAKGAEGVKSVVNKLTVQ